MLPVRNHTAEPIRGHMLLSFAATFLHVLVRNRMNILDTRYVAVPDALRERVGESDGEAVTVTLDDGTSTEMVLVQDPVASVLGTGTASVFRYAQQMPAEVFDREIVPCVPTAEVRDLYRAFGLEWPLAVAREGTTLTPLLKEGAVERCTRARAFAHRPCASDEAIEARRAKAAKAEARPSEGVEEQEDARARGRDRAPEGGRHLRGAPEAQTGKAEGVQEQEDARKGGGRQGGAVRLIRRTAVSPSGRGQPFVVINMGGNSG